MVIVAVTEPTEMRKTSGCSSMSSSMILNKMKSACARVVLVKVMFEVSGTKSSPSGEKVCNEDHELGLSKL